MTLRSIFFISALAVASHGIADEAKPAAGAAPQLTYCQQLGKTAGFEEGDLETFVKECEEKRAGDAKQGGGEQ